MTPELRRGIDRIRDYLFGGGSVAKRTTGIASVNKTQLGGFPVPVPPMELQTNYAEIVATAHGITSVAETAAGRVAALNASLVSRLLETGA